MDGTEPHNPDKKTDESHMAQAIQLAWANHGRTAPNPLVGAVIVKNGTVIGQGSHRGLGGPHAEKEALAKAGPKARGATAFVTLEPCSHFGRTGPCAQALIDAGISRVVIGTTDPNPLVSGSGLKLLANAGVKTVVGVLEEKARKLIAPFSHRMKTGRPWIHAKWAMTADGKIASLSGESRWISSPESRAWVHQQRSRVDAIVVGSGTAMADDPLLNPRPPGPRTPARILLDRRGRVSPDCQLASSIIEGPVVLITSPHSGTDWRARWRSRGVEVSVVEDGLQGLVDLAQSRGWTEIWAEGGATLLGALFERNWINEVHLFIGAKILGGAGALGPVGDPGAWTMDLAKNLELMEVERHGPDVRLRYQVTPDQIASGK